MRRGVRRLRQNAEKSSTTQERDGLPNQIVLLGELRSHYLFIFNLNSGYLQV